jgi:hypothetical protein
MLGSSRRKGSGFLKPAGTFLKEKNEGKRVVYILKGV